VWGNAEAPELTERRLGVPRDSDLGYSDNRSEVDFPSLLLSSKSMLTWLADFYAVLSCQGVQVVSWFFCVLLTLEGREGNVAMLYFEYFLQLSMSAGLEV
jgi:hypothetical protein